MKRMKDVRKSDIFSRCIKMGYLPRWGVLLLDLLLVLIAFSISIVIGSSLLHYDISRILLPIYNQSDAFRIVCKFIIDCNQYHI